MPTKKDRTAYMREYKRRQRAEAKKSGERICQVCMSSDPERKPRKGLATCDYCIESR